MNIPVDFKKKFQSLMHVSEYDEFISALHEPRVGLKLNRLKIGISQWLRITPLGQTLSLTKDSSG